MIITRTPYRVSFFGGGTDYPTWFREHGGAVLATTINRYCYIHCRVLPPFFEHKSRIVWSQIETVGDHAEIVHPSIRAVLQTFQIRQGVEIHHHGDLPARSGLGSSSAFTVGLLHAIHAMQGRLVSKKVLAEEAIHIEQEVLQESVGVQDQIETAFGGFNRIEIARDGQFEVRPISIHADRLRALEERLLLLYTGVSRTASSIASAQVAAIPKRTVELGRLVKLVDEAVNVLSGTGDLRDFGRLLHEGWQIKKSLTDKIAPAFVDEIYDTAIAAGADGGKLLGAGGGGFMLFAVDPARRQRVLQALERLLVVPFEFERQGTQVVFYEPEGSSRTKWAADREFVRYGLDGSKDPSV
jgi:D-glycero-alpha-D-manno-heptose-7-phosphate kinase